VPTIKPFRALRYEPEAVGDLGLVTSPPYDVIGHAEQRALLARHPKNVVRLDLPPEELGDEPDDRYRRAARTLATWRSDGTFHKDPRPSIYVYEQLYRLPGTDTERVQRGFFARLRLETFGPGAGVLPHERTLAGPREDRYKLLRATGANLSPVVGMYEDRSGRACELLATIGDGGFGAAVADVVDGDRTRHRLWVVAADGPTRDAATQLVELASAGPIAIADGHHRYETALRYRDERRMTRSCEEDPAFDYILALLLETLAEPPTVLPTHRVLVGAAGGGSGDAASGSLLNRADELFEVERGVPRDRLIAEFGSAAGGGRGRFGLWIAENGGEGAILTARRSRFGPWLPSGGDALRRLDVTLLGVALERLAGIDAGAVQAGGRVSYTKSAAEAIDLVDVGRDGAEAAFLLEPTPVAEVVAVAKDGDLMPQKSTYFYPKPLSGLVINPHEW
jgi:uncharacterized protein (DUF1015 family)